MKKYLNIDWKKFFRTAAVLLVLLLIADVVYDTFLRKLVWSAIYKTENLVIKTLTAFIGAYFYALKD